VRRYPTTGALSAGLGVTRAVRVTVAAGVVVSAASAIGVRLASPTGAAGTAAAVGVGCLPAVLTALAVSRRDPATVSAADSVTLFRAVLAGGCAAVTLMALEGAAPERTWYLVALVVPTLALDAVDGAVARRTGSATSAGAQLDMQVDAGVLVVLSVAVAPVLGGWVLLVGAMRYLYVAASWTWPVLRSPLPRSRFRRAVAGIQGVVLAAALAPVVPVGAAGVAVLVALVLLNASFGSQVVAILRRSATSRTGHPYRGRVQGVAVSGGAATARRRARSRARRPPT
jgi:phosphatidylglycerophosphate synthase